MGEDAIPGKVFLQGADGELLEMGDLGHLSLDSEPDYASTAPVKPVKTGSITFEITFNTVAFDSVLAAYLGDVDNALRAHKLYALLPALEKFVSECPACVRGPEALRNNIIHLNDTHRWDRNRIADWVDSLDADLTVRT
jgi:hypothetical protein